MKRLGVKISRYAQDLLNSPKLTITEQREEIELVVRTVADLGLSDGATTEEVYAAAKKQGLELCPPEVGPLLRLRSDTETRLGVFLVVAMEPITDSFGLPFESVLYAVPSRPLPPQSKRKAVFVCAIKNRSTQQTKNLLFVGYQTHPPQKARSRLRSQ